MKECKLCKELKPLDNFYIDHRNKDRRTSRCKTCMGIIKRAKTKERTYNKQEYDSYRRYRRDTHLRKTYGISLEEFETIRDLQNNKCFVCGCEETFETCHGERKPLSVDHNHKTGKIRRLLCGRCNLGIGFLRENPLIMIKAIKYLEVIKDVKK